MSKAQSSTQAATHAEQLAVEAERAAHVAREAQQAADDARAQRDEREAQLAAQWGAQHADTLEASAGDRRDYEARTAFDEAVAAGDGAQVLTAFLSWQKVRADAAAAAGFYADHLAATLPADEHNNTPEAARRARSGASRLAEPPRFADELGRAVAAAFAAERDERARGYNADRAAYVVAQLEAEGLA